MRDSLLSKNFYPANGVLVSGSPLLNLVDYTSTNTQHFVSNFNVVPKGVDDVIKQAVNNGYSCGKVVIAGHSMGGVLSRLYLQSTYRSRPYRNDIQKLITINTPHYGTQLAGAGLDLANTAVSEYNVLKLYMDGLTGSVASGQK